MKNIFLLFLLLAGFGQVTQADTAWPIRIAADQAVRQGIPIDLNTSNSPVFIRGDDLEFQIGFFQNGVLVSNWGNIASVTFFIYQSQNDTNTPLIVTNIPIAQINTNLTLASWTNGVDSTATNQHADIYIPSAASSVTLNGQTSQGYWMRITLSTTNSPVRTYTAMEGPITVIDGPIASVTPPTPAYFRFFQVNGNATPQLYDPVSAHYYNIEIDTINGVRAFSLGDTAY